jgi:hypothetical protein
LSIRKLPDEDPTREYPENGNAEREDPLSTTLVAVVEITTAQSAQEEGKAAVDERRTV